MCGSEIGAQGSSFGLRCSVFVVRGGETAGLGFWRLISVQLQVASAPNKDYEHPS